jgi:hypothetical protein
MADAIGQFFSLEDFLGVTKDLSFCAVGSACGRPFWCIVVGHPALCHLFRTLVHTVFGEFYGTRVLVIDFETKEEAVKVFGRDARIRRCITPPGPLEVPPQMFKNVAPLVTSLLLETFRAQIRIHMEKLTTPLPVAKARLSSE